MRVLDGFWPRRVALVAALGLWGGCGGDGAGESDEASASAPSSGAGSSGVVTDVRQISFADELEVDLEAMERRESGLYVQVVREGRGRPAARGDAMGVHYTVWLPNGSKLDSSHDHSPPEPLPMVLGETALIAGWVEGVTGMRLGERRKLVLPYDLAYGEAGRPGVPPYSPLVFVVELASHTPAGS